MFTVLWRELLQILHMNLSPFHYDFSCDQDGHQWQLEK